MLAAAFMADSSASSFPMTLGVIETASILGGFAAVRDRHGDRAVALVAVM